MSFNRPTLLEKLSDWLFHIVPTLVGIVVGCLSIKYLYMDIKSDFAVACLASAIAGYGFTATALVIALPRTDNKFLKYLDAKRGRIFEISIALCMPSITAVLNILGYALNVVSLKWLWDLLFVVVVFQFMWSILVLFNLLRKAHNNPSQ